MHSFGCFCFPLFYISMDFPFNLGQHCGGRQGIDFCPTGLTGTRISPSRWGLAAGCDKAQNIAWNLRANLLANQSETSIYFSQPDVSVPFASVSEWVRIGKRKQIFTTQQVQYPCWAKHSTCRRFLSNVEVPPLRPHRGQDADKLFVVSKNGDNCPEPRISKLASVEDLALHSPTRHGRENNKCGNENEWRPNVREKLRTWTYLCKTSKLFN